MRVGNLWVRRLSPRVDNVWARAPQVRNLLWYGPVWDVNIFEASKKDKPQYFVEVVKDKRRTKECK
jgi:hypothetical protein